jgi:peptide/nickel transport system substrate-binding protein
VSNAGGFSSPTVDGLLATITAELDPEARSARLAELDAVLGQELPSIPLYGIGTTVLADESLDNVIGSGFADGVFWNVTDWSVTG